MGWVGPVGFQQPFLWSLFGLRWTNYSHPSPLTPDALPTSGCAMHWMCIALFSGSMAVSTFTMLLCLRGRFSSLWQLVLCGRCDYLPHCRLVVLVACTTKGLFTTSLPTGIGMTHGSSHSQPYVGGASRLRPSTTFVLGYSPVGWVGRWD